MGQQEQDRQSDWDEIVAKVIEEDRELLDLFSD